MRTTTCCAPPPLHPHSSHTFVTPLLPHLPSHLTHTSPHPHTPHCTHTHLPSLLTHTHHRTLPSPMHTAPSPHTHTLHPLRTQPLDLRYSQLYGASMARIPTHAWARAAALHERVLRAQARAQHLALCARAQDGAGAAGLPGSGATPYQVRACSQALLVLLRAARVRLRTHSDSLHHSARARPCACHSALLHLA
jgi:hypothetical protein